MAALELINTTLYSDPNLVAYYQLENSNANIGGHNLSVTGTINYISAEFNNGSSSGTSNSSNCLSVANSLGIAQTACSFSFWIKILTEPSSNTAQALFGLRTVGSGSNYIDWILWYADVSGTKQLQFFRQKPGIGVDGPTYNIDLGTSNFNYIAFTYDNTNLNGYLNGALVAGPTSASGVGVGGGTLFTLHASNSGGPNDTSSCVIDDFAIFTRALTAQEINYLYNGIPSNNLSLLRTG